MEFICMACGRKHIRKGRLVDEHIHCECGYSFYAFYNQGMTVTIPSDEITRLAATKAFQRFVVSTGRCQDAGVEPFDYTRFLQKADPLGLMEVGLERYQAETMGKCLLNCGDITSICDSLRKNRDVVLKNKGSYVEVIEMQRKVKGKGEPPFSGEPIAYLNEEYRLKGWQKEIMERDEARTGYLFGEPG